MLVSCHHAVDVGPPVEPATAPGEIGLRLRRLESFAFRLEYRTDRPFELGAAFSGARDSSDRERWQGTWWRGADRRRFAVFGDGPVQYERLASGWSREPRGNESRIFDHLEQVVRAPQFVFEGEAGGVYRYAFEPRLPVLDPAGQKRIRGEIEIEGRTGLLLRVRCREEGGPARWDLRLSSFNRAGPVVVPFVPVREYTVVPAVTSGRGELGQAVRTVAARIDRLGRRSRLSRRWGRLVLELEREEPMAVVELLVGPARVELWAVVYEDDGDSTSVAVEVGGDASRRVVPVERLGGNGDFTVSTALEFAAQPAVVFTRRPDADAPGLPDGGLVVLLLDGRALDLARASDGRVEFGDAGGREFVQALAVVAELPATAGLKVVGSRRLLP
jgi:hypothetical protein